MNQIIPLEFQIKAIKNISTALENSRKALVVMATGLGKTIVSAYVIKGLLPHGKGLFLCHMNTGLEQAFRQYRSVLGESIRFGIFNGEKKHWDETDILFASFQTLTDWKHAFFHNEFRYIVVDEAHHSYAPTYKKVIDYFKPKEILALTATPDRMDQKDIREIFGDPVVNIGLEEAIANNWLAQVEYRLLTDNIDREMLTKITKNVLNGKKISIKQLNETIFINARDEQIANQIINYGGCRVIIFCENIIHANNFQKYLPNSQAYHSKNQLIDNQLVLESFRQGTCKYILVVNKMNECIDIPDADLIVFLRCTDSKTVFIQQLGRGLRRTESKKKVVVLDFVANADRIMMIREIVDRIKQFIPNWNELETNRHFVKGNGFDFIFTDEQISLIDILNRVQHRYVSDIPELLAEYSSKNTLPANKVFVCTRRQLIWKCIKCGHERIQTGNYRYRAYLKGCKCLKCARKYHDELDSIKFTHPELAKEYSSKNTIPITKVWAKRKDTFWWKCSKCNHEWQAAPSDRSQRFFTGCPACAKIITTRSHNLSLLFPQLIVEYSEKNVDPPEKISPYSGKKNIMSDYKYLWSKQIVQGGMAVYVSTPFLAREVSMCGGLGTVTGVAAHAVMTHVLQRGDPGGHYRRALEQFPFQEYVQPILDRYFVLGGIPPNSPFKPVPVFTLEPSEFLISLTIVANFVLVWLAKHDDYGVPYGNAISINYLEKMQLPHIFSFVGAMLADVDCITMGAGIPIQVPGILDSLSERGEGEYVIRVEGGKKTYSMRFSFKEFFKREFSPLKRPAFLPIISSNLLADLFFSNRATGEIQGLVVETPTAGGHNAPPRGKPIVYNELGEPLYGKRDVVDLQKIISSHPGLPVWIGGSYASPEKLKWALENGFAGIQVGSILALSEKSGMDPENARLARKLAYNNQLRIRTDPNASPAGFPFKVAPIPGTLYFQEVFTSRKRVCNLCALTTPYEKDDGSIGYRCPAEDVESYIRKGGKLEDTHDRRCLCNGLLANANASPLDPNSSSLGLNVTGEPAIVTLGDDLPFLKHLMENETSTYSVANAMKYLRQEIMKDIHREIQNQVT
ncbi:MAG: DEAD/DEAH box helicase family protein [Candidatus Paceibacterota bacterium]|jgi:nitronate monooxygenase